MKSFLNVLYRRILYKIPLKWLLFGLVVFAILLSSFSSALNVDGRFVSARFTNGEQVGPSAGMNFICFKTSDTSCSYLKLTEVNDLSNYTEGNPINTMVCIKYDETSNIIVNNNYSCLYSIIRMDLDSVTEEYCSVMSSLECQTEYNLIPINSVDSNYCTTNNLCPVEECPDIPVYTGDLSQLYINNVLHIGAPTILMDIPDEIDWDYEYTMGGNVMNIDIVGYNVDYDKINEQINLQNFKPSSEDLSQVVSGIIPLFVPGLCIILLLYFIFRFIKKIF